MSAYTECSAVISPCKKYRYALTRRWGHDGLPSALFIMLNPSTADGTKDDPTIRRCVGFAKDWGCGDLTVVNLFAFRATKPAELFRAADPVGPDNRDHIVRLAERTRNRMGEEFGEAQGFVVCAWGAHGWYMQQAETVMAWIGHCRPRALRVTESGQPAHPLYLPKNLKPVKFDPPVGSLSRRAA